MFLAVNAGKRSLAVSLRHERGREAVLRLADTRRRLPPEPPARARGAPRARVGGRARPQPAPRLLHGRRVRAHRSARERAGLRRAHAGGRRPHLDDGGARPSRRARRLVAHRHGDGHVGRPRNPRRAARARALRRRRARRHVALRDRSRVHRLPPRRLPRGRNRAEGTGNDVPDGRAVPGLPHARRRAHGRGRQRPAVRGCSATCSDYPSWSRTSASGRTRIGCATARSSSGSCRRVCARGTRAHWQERLTAAGVPAAPVADVADVAAAEQTEALGLLQPLEHDAIPGLRLPALPLSFDRERASTASAPPAVGEHSAEILSEAGYSDEEIAALEADGVIRTR